MGLIHAVSAHFLLRKCKPLGSKIRAAQKSNVEVTGAARLYRAASVWTAGLEVLPRVTRHEFELASLGEGNAKKCCYLVRSRSCELHSLRSTRHKYCGRCRARSHGGS